MGLALAVSFKTTHYFAGMSRQGHDLQLARHGAEGWQATFYTARRTAHSQTAAIGSAGDAGGVQ